jgi:hypothetical protein
MGLPYVRLRVEEDDDLRWAFRGSADLVIVCLFPRRPGTGRAKRAGMTLERQAEVALDSAALLDGFGGASEADPAGRTGMTCDQASISTRPPRRANRRISG